MAVRIEPATAMAAFFGATAGLEPGHESEQIARRGLEAGFLVSDLAASDQACADVTNAACASRPAHFLYRIFNGHLPSCVWCRGQGPVDVNSTLRALGQSAEPCGQTSVRGDNDMCSGNPGSNSPSGSNAPGKHRPQCHDTVIEAL
jgi:hypothetical protein